MTGACHLGRDELQRLQLGKLRATIAVLLESNAFYGDRLRDAGIDASVASLDDFTARMPLTTKSELAADQDAHPPYGSNLTEPIDRYVRLHQTSSTTGKPLRWLDTAKDWSAMIDAWVTVLEAIGMSARDRVFIPASFGPFIGFWLAFEAAERLGCLTIAGGAMNSTTRLRAILANDVTMVCCTPTYAIRLGQVARDEGVDLASSSVRTLIVAGEPGGSLPAVRSRIEALWPGARVTDHHGMTEIGPATYQCPDRVGVLHLLEGSLFCEYVAPEGDDSSEDGVRELVVTTLERPGAPLLRYQTGDLVRPGASGRCACGRTARTLEGGIIGRADDMIFVRGVNLYPSAIEQIIRDVPGVAEYRVEIREERGMCELSVLVEPDVNGAAELGETIAAQIGDAFRYQWSLRVPIEIVAPESLPRFEFKAKRWIRVDSEDSA